MPSLSGRFLGLLLLSAAALPRPSAAQSPPATQPLPVPRPTARPAQSPRTAAAQSCQGLRDLAVAAECRSLLAEHLVMPQVVAICGKLPSAPLSVQCMQVAADRQYSSEALDWCSRRTTPEDVVQCFALTGGPNRGTDAVYSPVSTGTSPVYNDTPTYPVAATPPPAPGAPAPAGQATEVSRQPLPTSVGRAAKPEVTQAPARRPPPGSLERVGKDVRGAVESPGGDWLERVGRDVRGGAESLGEALRPRPTNDPAYGPGPSSSPPSASPTR